MNNKKAIFILPYFGQFPNYFQLYLQSCKYNKDFDWLILTDNPASYEYPDNVIVQVMSFEDIKALIQSKFDFEVSLEKPYKLCDYRPTFGYIFQEYIVDYDFWGIVDPDCIWGNLGKYITWDILNKYDKLFLLGHLSIYRNTPDNNLMFMRPLNGVERYKEVFSSCEGKQFDEAINNKSINDIFSCYHIPVYENKSRADFSTYYFSIRLVEYEGPGVVERIESSKFQFFEWDKGVLYNISYNGLGMNKLMKEYSYLHLHGTRKMKCDKNISRDHFYVFRNRFLSGDYENKVFFVFIMYLDYLAALLRDFKRKCGKCFYSIFRKTTQKG